MGWEEIQLAVEYDGAQHWTDPRQYAHDVARQEHVAGLGWTVVRVVSQHRPGDVVRRVQNAWNALTLR